MVVLWLFQQIAGLQGLGSLFYRLKRHVGTLGNVQQAVLAVGQIQRPQQCHFKRWAVNGCAYVAVQAAFAQSWLAFGVLVH